MGGKHSTPTPAFRRSIWGYNRREVDIYLDEAAEDRVRLQEALARVEALLGEWHSGSEELRVTPKPTPPPLSKPVEARLPSLPATLSSLPATLSSADFSPEPTPDDDRSPAFAEDTSSLSAVKVFEQSRSDRRRRMRRLAGLAAAGAFVIAAIAYGTGDGGADASTARNAQTDVVAKPGDTVPARRGSSPRATAAKPATPGNAPSAAAIGKGLMLTISATKPCWIRTVVDGGQQMERMLAANETVMLHATNEVLVRVGDAAAVSLLINNRPVKPLGRSGEVVTRLITRANYSALLRAE